MVREDMNMNENTEEDILSDKLELEIYKDVAKEPLKRNFKGSGYLILPLYFLSKSSIGLSTSWSTNLTPWNIDSQSTIKWKLLSRTLMYLSISYKDSFFSEENETRAVVSLEHNRDEKYQIEQRETNYGKANFHRLKTSYEKFQSIEEVIIGPKRRLQGTRTIIKQSIGATRDTHYN
jgi:hypothetical protein